MFTDKKFGEVYSSNETFTPGRNRQAQEIAREFRDREPVRLQPGEAVMMMTKNGNYFCRFFRFADGRLVCYLPGSPSQTAESGVAGVISGRRDIEMFYKYDGFLQVRVTEKLTGDVALYLLSHNFLPIACCQHRWRLV